MPTLTITTTYDDTAVLTEAQLDAILDPVETFLNTTKINDDNIQTGGITASTYVADGTVTTAKILNSNVTTAKLGASSVTTAKITDANVTTAKIADSNVTTGKLAANAITTAKIADGVITKGKLATANYVLSSTCGVFTNGASTSDITNLSCTITTTGRPVEIRLISDGSGNPCYVSRGSVSSGGHSVSLRLLKDGSTLKDVLTGHGARYAFDEFVISNKTIPTGILYLDTPSSGTYTYKLQMETVSGVAAYLKLLVREL
jgi:hypothetical protein